MILIMACTPGIIARLVLISLAIHCAESSAINLVLENTTEIWTNKLIGQDDAYCDPGDATTNTFGWEDYSVLVSMCVISIGIGVFLMCFGEKQTNSDDFLLGGSSMGTAPVAMSIAGSFITAVELLGNPAEMYNFGSQFWLICSAFILVVPITSKLYLPVYMKLRLTSCFQYLEMRFSSKVRIIASMLYVFQMLLYTSVAVYAPALALSNVTGFSPMYTVAGVYAVCIIYSSQAGMKAVIITDTFQAVVLVCSLVAVAAYGQYDIGSFSEIWQHSMDTERLELFNMDPNPTVRHSFWTVVVGGTIYWSSMYCANQATIQKYLTVKKISQIRVALWVTCVSLISVYTINFYVGIIMTAKYKTCDPLRDEVITASDQLLPLYVIQTMGHLPGLPGLFVAGIFAASLGTVAAALTSISAAIMQDVLVGLCNLKFQQTVATHIVRGLTILAGVVSFSLVFVVQNLGSVLELALSFNGMVGGVTLGLFSLGMFYPWANSKGAITGATIAMALVSWICAGAQIAQSTGRITLERKETSIEGCPCYNNTIDPLEVPVDHADVLPLYKISYLWYAGAGCITTIVIGLIVSILTKPTNPSDVPEDLQSPPFVALYKSLPLSMQIYLNLIKDDPKNVEIITVSKRVSTNVSLGDGTYRLSNGIDNRQSNKAPESTIQ